MPIQLLVNAGLLPRLLRLTGATHPQLAPAVRCLPRLRVNVHTVAIPREPRAQAMCALSDVLVCGAAIVEVSPVLQHPSLSEQCGDCALVSP
jgi:hypothetical protein